MAGRWARPALSAALGRWRESVSRQERMRVVGERIVRRMMSFQLALAFDMWLSSNWKQICLWDVAGKVVH